MIVDELIAVLGYDIRGEAQRAHFERGLERLRGRMQGLTVAATRFAVIAGTATAAAFGVMGRSVINVNAQFEGFQAQLETIEGSSQAAKASMEWISDFATSTPYEIAGLTDAFVKLKSYGIDPVANDAMRTLGDAASAMNKPLNQAVEAFADASTFQFERLREFGIVANQEGEQVTFRYTKNGEQLQKVVQKNGEEVRKFLLENFGDRFNGAMERQSRTWNGILSNIGDLWTQFQKKIGDAGFFDTVKGQLQDLLTWINRLDENGTLQKWAERISASLESVVSFVTEAVTHIGQQIGNMIDLWENPKFRIAATAFSIAMAIAFAWAKPALLAMTGIALAFDELITYMAGGESIIGDAVEWFQRWFGLINENSEPATAKMYNLGIAVSYMSDVIGRLVSALKEMKEFFNADLGWMERLDRLGSGITGIGRSLLPEEGWLGEKADSALSFGTSVRRRVLGLDKEGSSPPSPDEYMSRLSDLSQLGGASAQGIVTDNSDKSVNVTSNITVNQNVTEATNAPGAAAQATGRAVGNAVGTASRVQAEGPR